MGSVALPVPPPAQGGTEWIAYYQTKGLAKRGHSIVLFAAKGSKANFSEQNIEIIEVGGGDVVAGASNEKQFDPRLIEASRRLRLEMVYLSEVVKGLIELKDKYDVILNNMRGEAIFLPIARLLEKPFVNVMHLNLFPELVKAFQAYNANIITISNAQRRDFPNINYLETVYNCVDIEKYAFNPNPGDNLLMVGSIGRHKNQGEAIKIAKALSMKLILAGKVRDQDYFEEIKNNIDGVQIKWVGEMAFEEKLKLYQNAKAFLFPIQWEEPFGLVLIEAMACGVPVVAFNKGAVAEVVKDGLTGYVVDNQEQMIEAVKEIENIDRAACRKHVEDNFSVEKMIGRYEKALQMLK